MFAPMKWFAGVVAVLALFTNAEAALTYNLGFVFSGTDVPASTPTATFDDVGNGDVSLTISGMVGTAEFLEDFYFNVNPSLNFGAITVTFDAGSKIGTYGTPTPQSVSSNNYKADGDGYYDARIDFDTAPPGDRFNGGDTAVFIIHSSATSLSFNDFAFTSSSVNGQGNGSSGTDPFFIAAHIQGTSTSSVWVTDGGQVPEPTSIVAWLVCTGGLGLVLRNRMKKSAA